MGGMQREGYFGLGLAVSFEGPSNITDQDLVTLSYKSQIDLDNVTQLCIPDGKSWYSLSFECK